MRDGQRYINKCVLDRNPATDGEEWFAMALLFASGRWGDGDPGSLFDYQGQANTILHEALTKENVEDDAPECEDTPDCATVTSMFTETVTGEIYPVFVPYGDAATYTNPSYHTPAFYELWGRWVQNGGDRQKWQQAAQSSRLFFRNSISDQWTSVNPFWDNTETGLMAKYAEFNGMPREGEDSFEHDAWRVAMNVAVDHAWFAADAAEVGQSDRLLEFFHGPAVWDNGNYGQKFELDGTEIDTQPAAGLKAMNAVAGLAATQNETTEAFVDKLWREPRPVGENRYYDGMLYMLGLLHTSGNFRIIQPGDVRLAITPAQGGELTLLQGPSYRVSFAASGVAEPVTVTLDTIESPQIPAGSSALGRAFSIEARNSDGDLVTSFPKPFTVTVEYNSYDLVGIDESTLRLAYWDENRDKWVEISSEIDLDGNKVTTVLDHLTRFVLLGEWQYRINLPIISKQESAR